MNTQPRSFLFTSESVTEGHPDKMCDQISDAILDAILAKEIDLARAGYIAPNGAPANPALFRCACETFISTGLVVVGGEVRTQAYVDVPEIVRSVIDEIGYNRGKYGFDAHTCGVMNAIHEQSPDIALGVDESYEIQHAAGSDSEHALDKYDTIGAGDQGMMFGYACDETPTLMPMPIYVAHRLAEKLTEVRKNETLDYLRPDGKTQVTIRYVDGRPQAVERVVVSTQHAEDVSMDTLRDDIVRFVVHPVLEAAHIELAPDAQEFTNPTGRLVVGGPGGDA